MEDFDPLLEIEDWLDSFYYIGEDWDGCFCDEYFTAEPHRLTKQAYETFKAYVKKLRSEQRLGG